MFNPSAWANEVLEYRDLRERYNVTNEDIAWLVEKAECGVLFPHPFALVLYKNMGLIQNV